MRAARARSSSPARSAAAAPSCPGPSSSRSYSRFRYHGRQSDKEKGADSTIPQLLENYYSTYDTYFETKGILKTFLTNIIQDACVFCEYRRAKKHGAGRFQWANGDVYHGLYVDDLRHGRGVHTLHDGTVYHDGRWNRGLPAT